MPLYPVNPLPLNEDGEVMVAIESPNPLPVRDAGIPISSKNEVVTVALPVVRLRSGAAYMATTGRIALAVAGNLRVTLENPTGSVKNLVITSIAAANDSSAFAWADVLVSPTAGLPAGVITPRNAILTPGMVGMPASVAVGRADTSTTTPLSGGVLIQQIGVPPNSRTVLGQGVFVLTPGTKVGINVAFTGAANSAFTAYLYEEPV